MKTISGTLSALFIALLMLCVAASAQEIEETQEAEEAQESEAVQKDDGGQDREAGQVTAETGAGRVLRLEKVLASDRARLSELKKDRETREQAFEKWSTDFEEREEKLNAMKAQLAETTDADERQALQAEIDAYTEKYEIVKSQTDLAFQAEKTVRGQAEALEKKIEMDQQALDVMTGKAEAPAAIKPSAPVPAVVPPVTQTPIPPPPGMIPGFPAVPGAAAPGPAPVILPETAEQIEARKQAEQSELEAEQAEQAVLSFLERKAALQQQIDMEKSLLETAKQASVNIDQAVEIRRQELADKIAAGAGQAEMRKAQQNLQDTNELLSQADNEIDTREDSLDGFHERMQALQEEQLVVTREAERKREDAGEARRESIWLDSPLNPLNVVRWAMDRGPRILAVILVIGVVLVLIRLFVQRIARAMVGKGQRHRRTSTTRADTLALSFGSAATVIIVVIGILMVFQEAGVDVRTILGGAAILGVAIAFGAQNLMRDYFNGFIILIEDQYELNDLVMINNTSGRVERVTLRTTALRDLQGKLHFIPNGEIKSVTNRSYEWARIVFDIRVAYKENVDRVMDVLMEVALKLCAEPEYKDAIMEDPQMLGVDQFSEFGVVIKFVLKTEPGELFRIKREMLRRIKNRFDELGIEIPIPDAVVLGR